MDRKAAAVDGTETGGQTDGHPVCGVLHWKRTSGSACTGLTDLQGDQQQQQIVYCILAASIGWIKQTYRKIMHTQNTQNHITGNDLVQTE